MRCIIRMEQRLSYCTGAVPRLPSVEFWTRLCYKLSMQSGVTRLIALHNFPPPESQRKDLDEHQLKEGPR
jgi:hypothetical protein